MTWTHGAVTAIAWMVVTSAAAVTAADPAPQGGDDDGGPQGVVGRVEKLTGDFMPRIGPPAGGGGQKRAPLAVPVHVFRGRVKVFEKPDRDHPALVAVVQADKEGKFRVPLESGEYTLVAEIDGRLYLNSMTGDGDWSPTRVEAGAWQDVLIQDTSAAVF